MINKYWLLVILGFMVAIFFWGRSTVSKVPAGIDNSQEIEKANNEVKLAQKKIDSLAVEDSLKGIKIIALNKQKEALTAQMEQETARIDSSIAKDSANAIPEYRKQLEMLSIAPSKAPQLTLKEISYGALFMGELRGLRLKIGIYEGEETEYAGRIADLQSIVKTYKDKYSSQQILTYYANQSAKFYQDKYESTTSFWYNRFNVSLSVGGFWTGTNFYPGIGITTGISIWNSK